MSMGLALHITMGTVGLVSAAAAMALRKGARPHRAVGTVFVGTMLVTSSSAVYLSLRIPFLPGAVEGALVFYWVATSWMTVRRKEGQVGLPEYGLLVLGLAIAAAGLTLGLEARVSPNGIKDGVPAAFYFLFAGLAAFSAAFDMRVIARGGILGAQRIIRHLWRMSAALTGAAANLFIGNSQVFPAALRETNVLFVPVILSFLLLIFWLIRVRFTNRYQRA
jgi:uncharacterized membrane protein